MDDAGLLGAKLDATGLDLADGAGDIHGDRADLRVGHEVARSEDAAEATDQTHHVRGGDGAVEVEPVLLENAVDQVLGAHEVGAGVAGLGGPVTLGEHDDAQGFAGTVGQGAARADHLVGVLRVDAEAGGDLDGLVELGPLEGGDQLAGLGDRVTLLAVDQLGDRIVLLAHCLACLFRGPGGALADERYPPPGCYRLCRGADPMSAGI